MMASAVSDELAGAVAIVTGAILMTDGGFSAQ
jgi:hypothetical protein